MPIQGSSKFGYLSLNSEIAPGGVTILDIEFDDSEGKWMLDKSQVVDFYIDPVPGSSNTFATISNCSGTVTPWGTIISCEETTSIETEAYCQNSNNTEKLRCVYFNQRDNNGDGYDDFGWAIEIDPATKTIINQEGGRSDKDKLWAMGNFKHENAVILADHKTVYQGADATNGDGYLFKFVAAQAQDLSRGELYVYKGDKVSDHSWLKLANTTQEEQNTTIAQCKTLEATPFGGIEDVEINPKDSLVYFAVKRESNEDLGLESKGVVYRFNDTTNGIEDFEIYAGGNSTYQVYDEENNVHEVVWGNGTDNLVFDDLGNLWVAQDESGDERNYIWVIDNGHTQLSPKVKIFARTPLNSEPTGLTFSPDYRYIFMSIQHPENNNSSQTDVFGTPVSFNEDVVLVIARNEHLGQDLTSVDQDIMISQYYHDQPTDSKWIEIKNISGHDIPVGSYFIDLYDSATLADIASAVPKASDSIPAMAQDEVLLFKNSSSPTLPQGQFIGTATQIESDICDFDGDDVLQITTTPGSRKYINRKDILGNTNVTLWGKNTSLARGSNSELPERDFNANNWIEMDSLKEVSMADKNKNIALGTHTLGPSEWEGNQWKNLSEPDRTRNVSIKSDFSLTDQNIQAYDFLVETDVKFSFVNDAENSNHSLSVYGDLKIDGSLIIGDTESFIMKNPSPIISGEIEKIEKSSSRGDQNDITYWSSPVKDEVIESVFDDVNPERIFYYDQSKNVSDDTYWDVWRKAEALMPMEVGKGYAAEGGPLAEGEQHEVSFKGTPNYGNIPTSTLYYNDDGGDNDNKDNDFNLIGNPYPSAINIESFLETNWKVNEVIDGTVYLWTHATPISGGEYSDNDYVTYNYVGGVATVENLEVTNNIGSAQGFFVRSLKAEPVVFDPSMILENSNDQFFKRSSEKNSEKKDRMWINLKGSDNSFKQVLIGFSESASDSMDTGYDAIYLDGGRQLGLYSLLDERKLVIQGLGTFEDAKRIDMGFAVKSEGLTLTMEIDRAEGILSEAEIILIDHELEVMHDLKQKEYQFNYDSIGEYLDRFSIVFNSTILSTEGVNEQIKVLVYIKDGELFVDSPEIINEIKIFDILGRLVLSHNPASEVVQLNIDKIDTGSFFIIKVTGENSLDISRKMIKY